jgi:hypothetical protein
MFLFARQGRDGGVTLAAELARSLRHRLVLSDADRLPAPPPAPTIPEGRSPVDLPHAPGVETRGEDGLRGVRGEAVRPPTPAEPLGGQGRGGGRGEADDKVLAPSPVAKASPVRYGALSIRGCRVDPFHAFPPLSLPGGLTATDRSRSECVIGAESEAMRLLYPGGRPLSAPL